MEKIRKKLREILGIDRDEKRGKHEVGCPHGIVLKNIKFQIRNIEGCHVGNPLL